MQTYSSWILVLFAFFTFPCSIADSLDDDPPGSDMAILQLKRFGTECILDEGINKGNTKEIVNKIQNIDVHLLSCYREMKRLFTSENEEETSPDIKANFPNPDISTAKRVKAYCKAVNQLTECIEPFLGDTFRKCKHPDGVAFLTLGKEVCKQDGGPVLEFVTAVEKHCKYNELKDREAFQNCLDKNFNSKIEKKNLMPYILQNSCKSVSDLKECAFVYLDQCKSPDPKKILEKYSNELKNKSPEANKCFFQESTRQNVQKPSKSGGYGSQKNLKPRHFWGK